MKKMLLSMGLIIFVSVTRPSFLQAAASDDIFLRSPIWSQRTLDSDVRLRSMGGLDLPVDDEANRIGLFKYGGSPSGLPLDYQEHKGEIYYSFESGKNEDNSVFASTFTGTISDTKQSSIGGFGAAHFTTPSFGQGTFVLGAAKDTNKQDYTQAYLDSQNLTSGENKPDVSNFITAYGHEFNNFLFGLGYATRDIDFLNTKSKTNPANGSLDIPLRINLNPSQIAPSVGYLFNIADHQRLIADVGPSFKKEKNTTDGFDLVALVPNKEIIDVNGTAFRGGLLYEMAESLKAAFFLETGKLDGDRRFTQAGSVDTGTAELQQDTYKLRAYYKLPTAPFSFGAEWIQDVGKTKTQNAAKTQVEDSKTQSNEVGLGVAGYFPQEKGLAGIQYTFINGEDSDAVSPTSTTKNKKRKGFQLALGSEYNVWKSLWARAGVRLKKVGEDPTGAAPELDTKTTEINLGFEARLAKNSRMALWYANTNIKSDGNQSAVATENVDEEKVTANRIQLVGTLRFGGDATK